MDITTKIKICGLQTVKEIEMINELDIDYVGFVFAPSKRRITLEKAKELRQILNPTIKAVGVFVNKTPERVNYIADFCNLDIVQLHGEETACFCSRTNKPVWKSVSVGCLEDVIKYKEYPLVAGILLDTFVEGKRGGTGKTFQWSMAKGLSKEKFIILAGGLTSNNIQESIREVRPHVVDVSSGVESKGIKDLDKIKEFIRSVKEYG